ncbi:MAG TPA: hypothetical protein DIS76_02160 [Rhodospirillaceae bacterium]|nr:hypothetical protein [Rhodospirillaceae bacterium]
MRILEDVYAIAEHEKADYVCSTTQDPLDLLKVLQREKLTGLRISDIYLHLCAGSAAHLTAALTVVAHPLHFTPEYHDSACYYLGLSHIKPIPIKEFHAGVAAQLKTITGQVMVH